MFVMKGLAHLYVVTDVMTGDAGCAPQLNK
jgi:hypothetical protein